MPPSRKHVAVEPLTVQVGDVGKALRTVTALVAETTACSAPTVLVEGVGDHAFGQQPRTKLRPFADLDELPSRGQPVSAAFDRAVAEGECRAQSSRRRLVGDARLWGDSLEDRGAPGGSVEDQPETADPMDTRDAT